MTRGSMALDKSGSAKACAQRPSEDLKGAPHLAKRDSQSFPPEEAQRLRLGREPRSDPPSTKRNRTRKRRPPPTPRLRAIA